jgi:hypothetical protein
MKGERGCDGAVGRPRNNDSGRVERILFASNILRHDLQKAICAEADDLIRESQAGAAAARGKRKPVITPEAARKRLGKAVKAELGLGYGPLTGLPPNLRLIGAITGGVARRDGYAAGRRLLVEALGHDLAFGCLRDPVTRDPATGARRFDPHIARENAWCLLDCMVMADCYIAEIEAQCRAGMNGENTAAPT